MFHNVVITPGKYSQQFGCYWICITDVPMKQIYRRGHTAEERVPNRKGLAPHLAEKGEGEIDEEGAGTGVLHRDAEDQEADHQRLPGGRTVEDGDHARARHDIAFAVGRDLWRDVEEGLNHRRNIDRFAGNA